MTDLLLILLVFFITIMIVPRLLTFFVRMRKGQKAPVSTSELKRVFKEDKPVLLYFSTPSCAACGKMSPVIDEIAKNSEYMTVKIDAAKDKKTARDYKIYGVPTTILVKYGVIEDVLVGIRSKTKLEKKLNALI